MEETIVGNVNHLSKFANLDYSYEDTVSGGLSIALIGNQRFTGRRR